MPPYLKTFFKILLSVLILGILFHQVQGYSLKVYFQSLQWGYFLLALIAQLVSSVLAAVRWHWLMKTLGFTASGQFYLKSYFKGLMFNQVLPSSIGGDAYRMLEVHKQLHTGKQHAIRVVLIDRLYGLLGLTLLTLLCLGWIYPLLSPRIFMLVSLLSFCLLLALLGLLLLKWSGFHFLKKIPGFKFFHELSKEFSSSANAPRDLLIKIILSILIHLFTVYAFYLLTKGLPVTASFTGYIAVIPTILLFTMLPLSFAGWGIREGAMVYFGALIGLAKPEALTISILFGFILILTSLPGVWFYLFGKHHHV